MSRRAHAARHVHGQDDGRLVGRHGDDRDRPAEREDERARRPREQRERQVAAQPRRAGRRVADERQARVADAGRPAPAQAPDVDADEQRHEQRAGAGDPATGSVMAGRPARPRDEAAPPSEQEEHEPDRRRSMRRSNSMCLASRTTRRRSSRRRPRRGASASSAPSYAPPVIVGDRRSIASSSWVWTWNPSSSSVAPSGLPSPPCRSGRPGRRRSRRPRSGPATWLFSPSVSRTMTAGAWTPGGTGVGVGRRLRRAVAVVVGRRAGVALVDASSDGQDARGRATCRAPAPGGRSRRATAAWSLVGAWTDRPASLKATTPITTPGGWRSTKRSRPPWRPPSGSARGRRRPCCRETSKARMTVPSCRGQVDRRLRPGEGEDQDRRSPTRMQGTPGTTLARTAGRSGDPLPRAPSAARCRDARRGVGRSGPR